MTRRTPPLRDPEDLHAAVSTEDRRTSRREGAGREQNRSLARTRASQTTRPETPSPSAMRATRPLDQRDGEPVSPRLAGPSPSRRRPGGRATRPKTHRIRKKPRGGEGREGAGSRRNRVGRNGCQRLRIGTEFEGARGAGARRAQSDQGWCRRERRVWERNGDGENAKNRQAPEAARRRV